MHTIGTDEAMAVETHLDTIMGYPLCFGSTQAMCKFISQFVLPSISMHLDLANVQRVAGSVDLPVLLQIYKIMEFSRCRVESVLPYSLNSRRNTFFLLVWSDFLHY